MYMNNLITNVLTLGSGGSTPVIDPAKTRFTLQGGTVETYDITGTLNQQWLIQNGYFDEDSWGWIKTITQADIGNTVTSIGEDAFDTCTGLTSVTMPNVTSIGYYAFATCSSLTSVTIGSGIQGIGTEAFATYGSPITLTISKTVAEVQAMGTTNYDSYTNTPYSEWGLPSGSTIVCTGGTGGTITV